MRNYLGTYSRSQSNLVGVEIRDLKINNDDRGTLIEAIRIDWPEVLKAFGGIRFGGSPILGSNNRIEQIYIVENHENAIRAYHKHEELVDIFCILRGTAKFILLDDRNGSDTFGKCQVINVDQRKPQIITVPTGIYHGWKGSKNCLLLSVANKLYKGSDYLSKLDEERIPWDANGKEIWDTEFK